MLKVEKRYTSVIKFVNSAKQKQVVICAQKPADKHAAGVKFIRFAFTCFVLSGFSN